MVYKIRYKSGFFILLMAILILASGCTKQEKNTEIVLTTDFKEDEVFRIEKSSCMLPEAMIYLITAKDQYESVFGPEIWEKDLGGSTLEEQVKDTTIDRIAQIKAMNLLADSYGVALEDEENSLAIQAAETFFSSLSKTEVQTLGITPELILQLYSEYALANKVYNYITKDINPEISDDEARTITVRHILIKTYALNADGGKLDYSGEQKKDALKRAKEIHTKAKSGADFDELIHQYNEDENSEYSFGQGSMPEAFDKAAFNLDTEQISDIVETEYGYHIIKCTSTFNREETDANKVNIVEKRKSEAFNKVYDQYLKTLTSNLNKKLWDAVKLKSQEEITTKNFFDVYNNVFVE